MDAFFVLPHVRTGNKFESIIKQDNGNVIAKIDTISVGVATCLLGYSTSR